MQQTAAFAAFATVLGGAYLLMRSLQTQQGSGGGQITTDNTSEGSFFDMNSMANQIAAAATPAPSGNPSALSSAGLAALQMREGFSATPYADHKGYSIGYGHLIKAGESLDFVTQGEALDLLLKDVAWAEKAVSDSITAQITQGQFDALVSFAYNIGAGAFKGSTLVRQINMGDSKASEQFDRWVYASGVVNSALVRRRQQERQQFESSTA
jgi:lysozyme